MRIIQLRKHRVFKVVLGALCLIPLIYLLSTYSKGSKSDVIQALGLEKTRKTVSY